jgi:hypothetical protein
VPFKNTWALLIMYHLINSTNFITSRLIIFKDVVPAKVVPPPRRKDSRETLLTWRGGNPTHATSEMMENVPIRYLLANLGTFVSSVGDHIGKGYVRSRRILMLDWHHTAHCNVAVFLSRFFYRGK